MSMAFLLLVAVVIWLGVFAFVWMLDKKATALEQRALRLENKQ
jgi:CcmD family protein